MNTNEDPGFVALSLRQQYKQTIKLDKTTSRMSNKDWYRDALDLDLQLHCYVKDESSMDCYLYSQSRQVYEKVGSLNLKQLVSREQHQAFIQEIFKRDSLCSPKAKSLGVIFYLADEFSLAGLGPEHSDPDTLLELKDLILEDPKEVMEDKTVSVETHAWRMLPFRGAPSGDFATAVAVSREFDAFLVSLREYGNGHNFPIRTCALSAPLCAVASMPWCASASPHGTVAIYNYAKFTVLAFFNSSCDLMMLRHISHTQGSSIPRNLGPSVFSAATSFELENPEIYIFSMLGADVQGEVLNLQTAMKDSDIMVVEVRDILNSRGVNELIPLEVLTTTQEQDPAVYPLAGNTTFEDFKEDGWTVQDFLTPSHEELQKNPGAGAMLLLKVSRWLKMAAALALAGLLVYSGLDIGKKITSEAWHFKKEDSQARLAGLQRKVHDYQRWDKLLASRSQGWVSMELLSEFVPNDGSMVLTSANYKAAKNSQQGIVKIWTITGKTTGKRYQELDASYNTRDPKAIKALFRKVAENTGDVSYAPDVDGRKLSVQFSRKSATSRRSRSGGVGGGLPISFTLSVTLSYSQNDSISLTGIQ